MVGDSGAVSGEIVVGWENGGGQRYGQRWDRDVREGGGMGMDDGGGGKLLGGGGGGGGLDGQ